jgi:hypothetical protein
MTSITEEVLTQATATAKLDFLRSATNLTHYAPSALDLVMAGPRMAMKLGSFALVTIPEAVDSALGLGMAQRVIPEATGGGEANLATTAAAGVANNLPQTNIMREVEELAEGGLGSRFSLDSVRNLGGIFSYATSKWALTCIFMAVVLNRTYVYASIRRNLELGWRTRLALRITPIILLLSQSFTLLQSIQCQTSPDFAELRWGNASRNSDFLFTQNGGMLHTLSSSLLLGRSDEASCLAVGMIPSKQTKESNNSTPQLLTGSLSRLWPLFQSLCYSQFVETISCAVQGRMVAAEAGMTLFEHSLAFAEADANANNQLGWGLSYAGKKAKENQPLDAEDSIGEDVAKKRSLLLDALNTPPEILFIALISAMNHATSHILGIFNMQGRLRLLNTAIWGTCFMGMITWSFLNFSGDIDGNHSLLRYPTVCIVGFVPHMAVLAGIILCCAIYLTALVLTACASPAPVATDGQRLPWMARLRAAHSNLQADLPISSAHISMHMDFYTALLKTGFQALTIASEAVYLNETNGVSISRMTWLEQDRLAEIEKNGANWLGPSFRGSADGGIDGIDEGLQTMNVLQNSTSGFAKERTADKASNKAKSSNKVRRDGVGATERTGRWIMALDFFAGIAHLVASLSASLLLSVLARIGVRQRPAWFLVWLRKLSGTEKVGDGDSAEGSRNDRVTLDFWMVNKNGELTLPEDEQVDVEVEMRNRLFAERSQWNDSHEQHLSETLYRWWVNGGWWGEQDTSGEYHNDVDSDDDNTSVISISDTLNEWESDFDNDDGRRTPTQEDPRFTRESTPITDTPLRPEDLARLLHPQTPDERAEAQALASHMASDTILTRSKYRELHQRARARVLTSTRLRPAEFRSQSRRRGKLTAEEEVELLDYLIVSRRAETAETAPATWANGAAGMGEGGPQCVVCQSTPRSIIVWPCRCLSLCDDCRVNLAMNNFDKCVCCRREVSSFSRIFVP